MRLWRLIAVTTLLLIPVVVFGGIGLYSLWEDGTLGWLWWLIPICWGVAWLLARRWNQHFAPPAAPALEAPVYWTDQDRQALKLVEAQEQVTQRLKPDRLIDPHFYLETALELSLKLAQHYHPRARDPLSSVTVPEILAVAHLASEDLEQWVRKYVPGSPLLTVHQWRLLSKAPGWFRTISNVSWAVSILLYPANIGRFLTSRLAINSARKQIQNNILAWFYVFFVRYVGFYMIEMNSGRLRGGAARYRRAVRTLKTRRGEFPDLLVAPGMTTDEKEPGPVEPLTVQIAVIGQVKAGKSSLINALLGQQQAATDVIPLTREVQQYILTLPSAHGSLTAADNGSPADRLILLDTAGYADNAQPANARRQTEAALHDADLILMVMDVTTPARQADLRVLQEIADWYDRRPQRKRPAVLGVLTHIDGLRPVLEWSPPYDWLQPRQPKAQSIHDAVDFNRQQFGQLLAAIVPVCCDMDRQRVYGVQEWLVPAMLPLLDHARAASLVRALHAQAQGERVQEILTQLRNIGLALLSAYLQEISKSGQK